MVEGIGIRVLVGFAVSDIVILCLISVGQLLLTFIPETFKPPQIYWFPRASTDIRFG